MNIQYQIVKLDEVKYLFNFDFDYSTLDMKSVIYEFNHIIDSNNERGEVFIEIRVRFVASEKTLAEQGVRATFAVSPYDAVVVEKNEKGIKSNAPELIDTFANVTIGALRGMIAKNLKGTPLERCVLPLISMEFLHKMISNKD